MSPKVSEQHKEQRRREILLAAKAVFQRKGFNATTMQDIVEEADISRGGLYMYYSNKDDMFKALLEMQDEHIEQAMEELIQGHLTVWDAIQSYLLMFEQQMPLVALDFGPVAFEVFSIAWRDQSQRPFLVERYQKGMRMYEEFVEIGVQRGEFRPLLPIPVIARTVAALTDGLMLHTLHLGVESVDVKGQVESMRLYLKHVLQVT